MKRILVIDDDQQILAFMKSSLEWRGFAVHTATRGAAGLALLRQHGADVVFCDIYMPDMNGLQTLEQIASLDHAPPIILMSGAHNKDETLASAALRYEMVWTLEKPFHLHTLFEVLNEALAAASVPEAEGPNNS